MKSVLHNIQGIAKASAIQLPIPHNVTPCCSLAAKFSEKPLLATLKRCVFLLPSVLDHPACLRLIEAIEKMKFRWLSSLPSSSYLNDQNFAGNNVKRMFNVAKLIVLSNMVRWVWDIAHQQYDAASIILLSVKTHEILGV